LEEKVDVLLKMSAPKTIAQLRYFLGVVTCHRNMWPRRSHLLAPLTTLTGKSVFDWTVACQAAFEKMKAVLAADVCLSHPNHNLPFEETHTCASNYQMGAVIIQNGKPVACWSRKFNPTQQNDSTMETYLSHFLIIQR
jgi:hypothetical protein